MSELLVEGKKVCKLICVSIDDGKTAQSNKYYNMYEQDDSTFIAEYGRVDCAPQIKEYPMSKWDSVIKSKKSKSGSIYTEVTHLFAESDSSTPSNIVDIKDSKVKSLMDILQRFANNSIQENYSVSSKSVTQAQIDEAQDKVNSILDAAKLRRKTDDINKQLIELYHIIPRRMKDVRDHIFEKDAKINKALLDDIKSQIAEEQATLDVMAGQVLINDETDDTVKSDHKDILTMLGVEIEAASTEEYDFAVSKMGSNKGQVKRVFTVKHLATEKKFDNHLKSVDDKHVRHFFHGSRNQNWLNIISTGLMIRPAGALYTGSMFGDGIYFADKAQKSIGYTSLRGSYWASGSDNTAYLALFKVHTGKWKRIKHHTRDCYSLSLRAF